ncbi:MAG: acetyltransferase, ribosomal protein N-acetylase [Ilumatobacteraceae bacterium]|nr:acetyltransferase, ribosomal protein N-acetylase [Ilumatobacteraceae bacterium]
MRLEPFTLTGNAVRLEPLALHHAPGLLAAADVDRSSYGFTPVPADLAAMEEYIAWLLGDARRDQVVPFAQRRVADDALVGCTRFLNLAWWPQRQHPTEVEIGGTWLGADAQRGPINTEAKLLLLTHAFEQWGVHRVAICTDALNQKSRRAIERIGATFEGVLRQHRASTGHATVPGTPRDTAAYSIIADEWPAIRAGLISRCHRAGSASAGSDSAGSDSAGSDSAGADSVA